MEHKSRRGPYAKSAAQRERILDAATELFAQQGYTGTSLRGVAESAGFTFTGLRHYYSSKELLLIAVLQRRDDEHREFQLAERGGTLTDALTALFGHVLSEPQATEIFTTVAAEAVSPRHPAHEFFLDRYRRVRAQFERDIRSISDGASPALPPERLAVLLVAVMDGLQLQHLLDVEVDAQSALDDFLSLTLHNE